MNGFPGLTTPTSASTWLEQRPGSRSAKGLNQPANAI
jgi:hypothetical protein